MRRVIYFLALLPVFVHAAPFVVSDPVDQTATHCGFKMNAGTRTVICPTGKPCWSKP